MTLDEMIKKLGVFNTGIGMKIIMKDDATKRQVELAKEFYPKASVIKEVKEEKLDYRGYIDITPKFVVEEIHHGKTKKPESDIDILELLYPEINKDIPLYSEIAA